MRIPSCRTALITLCLTVGACRDDGRADSEGATEGTGTGTASSAEGTATGSGSADSGMSASASSTGTSTNTGPTTTTDDATSAGSETGTGETGGACSSIVVTYDLTGSVIQIDALVDFEITVQEPYTDDLNTGPGTITVRFADDGNGNPVAGTAQIIEYSLDQNFVTGSQGLAVVTTDLTTTSGPDACGTAVGEFDGSAIAWNPAELDPYCRDGMVSCEGTVCGTQGAPPSDMPFVFADDCTEPFPLNDFEFTNGVDAFTMSAVTVSMDNNQTVTQTFVGAAVDTMIDAQTPACACP